MRRIFWNQFFGSRRVGNRVSSFGYQNKQPWPPCHRANAVAPAKGTALLQNAESFPRSRLQL